MRARISAKSPSALGICDRCAFTYNLVDLKYQFQWQGPRLQNLQKKVCRTCLDVPQEQLRTIILPADPVPVADPRVPLYEQYVPSYLGTLEGQNFVTDTGAPLTLMIKVVPYPDPPNTYTYEGQIPS